MFFDQYLKNLENILAKIKIKDFKNFISAIRKAKRIYVYGAGRSGLIAKYLAMRLVRINKETYVIGETVTPKVEKGNLLIAISGSGETGEVLSVVKICRVMGANILGITATSNSPLSNLAHWLIIIPAEIPKRMGNQYQLRELIGVPERPPLKSLFEVAVLIFLEVSIAKFNGNE